MNAAMQRLDGLVGEWSVTMTHAWFLDSLDTEIKGSATFEWLADAFLVMQSHWEDDSTQAFVFGRSDARDEYVAFSHDDRGVYRVFAMTFREGEWTLLREDPDFHQRIVMRVQPDRIDLRADASDDTGKTWRKDLDYIFERRAGAKGG
ncbi:MAG: hypothetical protein K0S97_1074 [Chloroflexota bacterium]|nr:hypothetical protein [Chloroflexota bacterium]